MSQFEEVGSAEEADADAAVGSRCLGRLWVQRKAAGERAWAQRTASAGPAGLVPF